MSLIKTSLTVALIASIFLSIDCRMMRPKGAGPGSDPVHTWHTIVSLNGTWYGTLHIMTENEKGIFFVDDTFNQSNIQNPFTVSEWSPFTYGLVVHDEDDFNMLYSLSLNQQLPPDPDHSNSRICVYLIGAQRPFHPQIVPVSFNGNTTCLWRSVEGFGENFWIM